MGLIDKVTDDLREMRLEIGRLIAKVALRQEANFSGRIQAIDRMEFHVLDRLEGLPDMSGNSSEARLIRDQAESLKGLLENINDELFQGLREKIRTGTALRNILRQYAPDHTVENSPYAGEGYDLLDAFLDGLFFPGSLLSETRPLEPEMVSHQKTPARVVVELVKRAHFKPADVFYDLGSGLGQVSLLVNLLGGVTVKGVEYEPSYCDYAARCAADLGLSGVTFLNADVRDANLSDGTVFFLYTPFTGKMLAAVLEKLRGEAERRPIRIFTYGPCTFEVSRQGWLRAESADPGDPHRLGMFASP